MEWHNNSFESDVRMNMMQWVNEETMIKYKIKVFMRV